MRTAKTPKSTPTRIDERIMSELRQVVAEKDLRVLFVSGNLKEVREQFDNHTSMAETMTQRGLIEMILFNAIDYLREHGELPEATVPEFDENDTSIYLGGKAWSDWSRRNQKMVALAYQNNWLRDTETETGIKEDSQ